MRRRGGEEERRRGGEEERRRGGEEERRRGGEEERRRGGEEERRRGGEEERRRGGEKGGDTYMLLGDPVVGGSFDWHVGTVLTGYRPGSYFFVDEGNPSGGM